jgi:VWFA-related protein
MNWKWLRCIICRAASLALLMGFAYQAPAVTAWAQEGAAGKSPAAQTTPKTDSTEPTKEITPYVIPVNVHYVTTPVTVFDSSGQFVYDLEKDEFKVYDNGQLQDIKQFDSEMRKLSLVIVVETNDTTVPFLESVRSLGSMFSDAVMGPQGEVAVLTYSDHVEMPLDFTSNGDKLDTVLRGLHGRGGGMHLDDAIARALSKLDSREADKLHKGDRKVVIIFSDGFNMGSQMKRSEIVQRAMNSDITVYGLGFSPVKGLWDKPAKDPAPDLVAESVGRTMGPNQAPTPTNQENTWDTADIPIMSILLGLGEEAKKPIFKDSMIYFARYSGGQSYQKWGKDTVQQALNQIATEIHSQYELAYAPSNATQVGFHKIEVQVRRPGAKVRARAGWFYQGEPARGVLVK